MRTSSSSKQASTTVLLILALLSLVQYAFFLFSGQAIGNPFAFLLLCLAEIIGMLQLVGIWGTILFQRGQQEHPGIDVIRDALTKVHAKRVPKDLVAVFIPVAGEPLSVIRRGFISARDIDLPHRTIVLDDGESDDVRDLAAEVGVEYLRRPTHDGRKAGNINYGLAHVQSEYFAIFDCDYVVKQEFLTETLPFLLHDPGLAFVQTPQYYDNRDGFVAGGSADIQDVFYRHVQPGKNAFGAAFCVGTNVLLRRSAIDQIGGIYEASNSEDIWTSILLHERGWRSHFHPKVLAAGNSPETLGDFFRQQFRWSRGGLEIFFSHNPFTRNLTLDQKIQYAHTATHYLGSISVLIFYVLPLLYVYAGMKPLVIEDPWVWVSKFLPYYAMFFITTAHLMGKFPRWRTIVIGMAAFPAHLAALFSVLTGLNVRWSVTGVIKEQRDYLFSVAPQLLLLLLSGAALPILPFVADSALLAVLMSIWLALNCATLFSTCRHAFPQKQHREESLAPSVLTYTS